MTGETPDIVYGRLLESAHISGYSFERVCSELEWLLEDDRWRQVGPGYEQFGVFLKTVDLSPFNIDRESRKKLAFRMAELEASTRQVAKALGVSHETARQDVKSLTPEPEEPAHHTPSEAAAVKDLTPEPEPPREWFQHDDNDIVKHAQKVARKEQSAAARRAGSEKAESVIGGGGGGDVAPLKAGWHELGDHLLYCGDSTDAEFVKRADPATFCFADPPYNVGAAEWDYGFMWAHDYLTDVAPVVAVTPGNAALRDFMRLTDMPYRWSLAAWINNGMTRGAVGFGNWIHVLLFANASIYADAQDHTTISIGAHPGAKHKGRKPAELLVWLLNLYTEPSDIVVDPFAGSGTTLFAADTLGRKCITAEVDPVSAARIVTAWEGRRSGA